MLVEDCGGVDRSGFGVFKSRCDNRSVRVGVTSQQSQAEGKLFWLQDTSDSGLTRVVPRSLLKEVSKRGLPKRSPKRDLQERSQKGL